MTCLFIFCLFCFKNLLAIFYVGMLFELRCKLCRKSVSEFLKYRIGRRSAHHKFEFVEKNEININLFKITFI